MKTPAGPTSASYAMLVSLILIWGTAFLLVKIAVETVHPSAVAAARVLFAAAVVIPFAILTKRGLPKGARRWVTCAIAGVLSLALPITLLAWAQQTVPSGVVGVYMAAIPLLVLPLAHFFSPGEAMTREKLIGFIIGFIGLLLLIGFETVMQLGSADGLAQLACLATALCYATSSLIIRTAPKTDPIAFSAVALFFASLLVLPLGIIHWPTERADPDSHMGNLDLDRRDCNRLGDGLARDGHLDGRFGLYVDCRILPTRRRIICWSPLRRRDNQPR